MANVNEIWQPVKGYEGFYEVSNLGRVKSLQRTVPHNGSKVKTYPEKILAKSPHKRGYVYYKLCRNGIEKIVKGHRLVAKNFIPNPNNLPEINHINGIRNDNRVENLEWCSRKHNHSHAIITGLWKPLKGERHGMSRKIIDRTTGKIYSSIEEAARLNNMNKSSLGNMLTGHRKNKTTLDYFK